MAQFTAEIFVTTRALVTIEAESAADAYDMAEQMWFDGELDLEDFEHEINLSER